MTTQLELSRTGSDGTPVARLTQSLLHARAALPPAANGKPPKAQSPRAIYLRNEIGAGRMKPMENLWSVIADDLASGVPASEHLAWIDQLRADVEALAVCEYQRRHETPVAIQIVREVMRETQTQGPADIAQERVLVEPENVAALEAFAVKGTRHYVQLGTTLALVRQALSVKRGELSRRVYGARRPA